MTRTALLMLLMMIALLPSPGHTAAEVLRLDAGQLYERSITHDVRLSDSGEAIELDEGELIEDDGPAAGYSYQPNEERLSDRVWARKTLVISNPAARAATLLIAPGGEVFAEINGEPVELRSRGKAGNYWQTYAIPPGVLKRGENQIVLRGEGKLWIARAEDFAAGSVRRTEHPNRSARSTDGGETWNDQRLGAAGDIDGEYYVRLFLHRHRSAGSMTLPVMDIGNLAGRAIAPPLSRAVPVRIHADGDGDVRLRIRSGASAAPDETWSPWQPIASGEALDEPRGRFFQIAADLSTPDPLRTPRLKAMRIEASPHVADDWSAKLRVIESNNATIVRSAVPFAYEPFDHPKLKELRRRYELDAVVEGAKSELELMERLARWSAGLWRRGHLGEGYPPWDALHILRPHADGTPIGGFCQQYNIVLLQACASLGIPGRAVSISVGDHGGDIPGSGHEVVELWSNQFRKWIYIDGNMAWYAVDDESNVPLSLWELRQRQLAVLNGEPAAATRIVHLNEGGKRWTGLRGWPAFLELRLIPRSNFLAEAAPLPLNQGMRGWFWTGHHVWTDAAYPASLLYSRRLTDRRNWSWTLNQCRFTLEATPTPRKLRVHLDTHTPGLQAFIARIDGGTPSAVEPGFTWSLHEGENQLEVYTRNIAGRRGIPSRVMIHAPANPTSEETQ